MELACEGIPSWNRGLGTDKEVVVRSEVAKGKSGANGYSHRTFVS